MYQGLPQNPVEIHPHRKKIWTQWDKQTNDRQVAYIQLNNLYLAVERGDTKMSIHVGNELSIMVMKVYPYGTGNQRLRDYWETELQKLPDWNDF